MSLPFPLCTGIPEGTWGFGFLSSDLMRMRETPAAATVDRMLTMRMLNRISKVIDQSVTSVEEHGEILAASRKVVKRIRNEFLSIFS